jgi:type II secretory pathway pseudopilin PulG
MATTFRRRDLGQTIALSTGGYKVNAKFRPNDQRGFSIVEMLIAISCMLIVTVAVTSLVRSSMQVATATYELTEAQENLRTVQEYVNRDLMNAGDGLKSVTYIPVNKAFVENYLSTSPVVDTTLPSDVTNLGILTTDNNVSEIPVIQPSASPSPTPVNLRAGTDRQTILAIDPSPTNIAYSPTTIDSIGSLITLPSGTDMTKFTNGEIWFLTSSKGGTFAAITNVDATNKRLTFANGDTCGLNVTGSSGRIRDIAFNSSGALIATSLLRMRIIHYFVDSTGLLTRREFGVIGRPYRDSIIAEHVVGVQFIYSLGIDSGGNPVQPTSVLSTPAQQVAISQVEVNVTVETPHALQSGNMQNITATTSTSLRNMQFRQALQPKASPTP